MNWNFFLRTKEKKEEELTDKEIDILLGNERDESKWPKKISPATDVKNFVGVIFAINAGERKKALEMVKE